MIKKLLFSLFLLIIQQISIAQTETIGIHVDKDTYFINFGSHPKMKLYFHFKDNVDLSQVADNFEYAQYYYDATIAENTVANVKAKLKARLNGQSNDTDLWPGTKPANSKEKHCGFSGKALFHEYYHWVIVAIKLKNGNFIFSDVYDINVTYPGEQLIQNFEGIVKDRIYVRSVYDLMKISIEPHPTDLSWGGPFKTEVIYTNGKIGSEEIHEVNNHFLRTLVDPTDPTLIPNGIRFTANYSIGPVSKTVPIVYDTKSRGLPNITITEGECNGNMKMVTINPSGGAGEYEYYVTLLDEKGVELKYPNTNSPISAADPNPCAGAENIAERAYFYSTLPNHEGRQSIMLPVGYNYRFHIRDAYGITYSQNSLFGVPNGNENTFDKRIECAKIVTPSLSIGQFTKLNYCFNDTFTVSPEFLGENVLNSDLYASFINSNNSIQVKLDKSPTTLNNIFKVDQQKLSGKYWFKLLDKTKSIQSKDSVEVYFSPQYSINIEGENSFCEGGSTTLKLNTLADLKEISWFFYDNKVAESTKSLTATAEGTYYLITKNTDGCEVKSNVLEVNKTVKPDLKINISGNTTLVSGETVKLAVIDNTKYIYQWYLNGTQVPSGGNKATFVADKSGTYKVVIKTETCSFTSADVIISTLLAAENNLKIQKLVIYPNPNDKFIKISTSTNLNQNVDLKIVSTNGKSLYSKSIRLNNGKSDEIDITEIPAGKYFISFQVKRENFQGKFVKSI